MGMEVFVTRLTAAPVTVVSAVAVLVLCCRGPGTVDNGDLLGEGRTAAESTAGDGGTEGEPGFEVVFVDRRPSGDSLPPDSKEVTALPPDAGIEGVSDLADALQDAASETVDVSPDLEIDDVAVVDAAEDVPPLPLGCYNPPAEPPPGAYLPVGVWYNWMGANGKEDHDRAHYASSLAGLKAHGIDLVIAVFVFGANRVWLLEEADKLGVKVIMGMPEMTVLISQPFVTLPQLAEPLAADLAAPVSGHPGLYGYYLADEPGIHNILPVNLFVGKSAFEKADPEHPSFVIFALLNKMQEYFLVMQPEVLLTDMYPLYNVITWPGLFINGWHIDSFLDHLKIAREIAGAKPTWLVAQAFANILQWRMPVFEEIRAMVFLALNRGVRGIVYFCLYSVPGGENLEGLLNILEQPTGNYEQMTSFHQKLEPVKTALLWSEPVGKFADVQFPFDLGCFQHEMGFRYLSVVNRDVESDRTASIKISAASVPSIQAIFDEITGEEMQFSLSGGEVQFSAELGPGDGRMFRICTD